ncbi:hypothetical protein D3C84_1197760 [compost metagenome]
MEDRQFVITERRDRLVALDEGPRRFEQLLAITQRIGHRHHNIVDQRGADHVTEIEECGHP